MTVRTRRFNEKKEAYLGFLEAYNEWIPPALSGEHEDIDINAVMMKASIANDRVVLVGSPDVVFHANKLMGALMLISTRQTTVEKSEASRLYNQMRDSMRLDLGVDSSVVKFN